MAWSKKTWVQRIVENVGRRLLTPTTDTNVFDITRNEGTIIQAGDGFTVSNMNDLENRIDSGFTDVNTVLGKPKQAPTGTKVVVATSLVAGNTFTAPSNGVYQLKTIYTVANSGFITTTLSNGQTHNQIAPGAAGYTIANQIPVNTGQVLTITGTGSISTVELAFFPMV